MDKTFDINIKKEYLKYKSGVIKIKIEIIKEQFFRNVKIVDKQKKIIRGIK